jgi:hypothetical protein
MPAPLVLIITILVVALVLSLLLWALSFLPIPQPFLNIIKFIIILIFTIWVLYTVLPVAGHPAFLR